ncbi:MAG: hypothetical protein A2Z34_03665 [Planctomycetes bacterium RBG_16_59_8]|nr:MAG: hypothetical protein A2Z34_03665 [Planctomycetes bacterium RBG_16_59_8]
MKKRPFVSLFVRTLVVGAALSVALTVAPLPVSAQSMIPDWMRKAVNEYRQKAAEVKKGDAESLCQLGLWARKAGLDGLAHLQFRKAIEVDANHAGAREGDGYVKKGSKWTRDYLSPAKKIKAVFDPALTASPNYAAFKKFLDEPKNLEAILKQIDEQVGLYRTADEIEIELQLKAQASGVGVTWPVSAMGNDRVPPPFVSAVELDGGVILGKDLNFLRMVVTHELTHALMGAVQIFLDPYQAEGIASYAADDPVKVYAQYKAFWVGLKGKHGAKKVKEWTQLLTDGYADLWIEGASSIPDAAFKKVYGKTGKELGGQ